ncbi:MAG: hypothetical protein AAF206_10995 [Bacteroidota bacterium]
MTPALRQRHRFMWLALAVLLPLGFGAAWMVVPESPSAQLPAATETQFAAMGNCCKFYLTDTENGRMLDVESHGLHGPSFLLYISKNEDTQGGLLGVLSGEKRHRFQLDSAMSVAPRLYVQIQNGLTKDVLEMITLSP